MRRAIRITNRPVARENMRPRPAWWAIAAPRPRRGSSVPACWASPVPPARRRTGQSPTGSPAAPPATPFGHECAGPRRSRAWRRACRGFPPAWHRRQDGTLRGFGGGSGAPDMINWNSLAAEAGDRVAAWLARTLVARKSDAPNTRRTIRHACAVTHGRECWFSMSAPSVTHQSHVPSAGVPAPARPRRARQPNPP